jgi:hypothetical protein
MNKWRNTERNRLRRKKGYREDEYEIGRKEEWRTNEETELELRREAKYYHRFTVYKYRAIQNRSGFFKKFIEI